MSYLSWTAGVIDSVVYPILAFDIVSKPLLPAGHELDPWLAYAFKLAICAVWMVPNFIGIQCVGKGMVLLGFIVLSPFVALTILCLSHATWSNVFVVSPEGGQVSSWMSLFNVIYWSMAGFDCISTIAGEVQNPGKTLPKALFITIVMVVLTYLLPLVAATGSLKRFTCLRTVVTLAL